MKITKLVKGGVFSILVLTNNVYADNSVSVDGTTYTCTNTCNVTTTGAGQFSVQDCCGGRVRSVIGSQGGGGGPGDNG